jgi:quinol monooxygenase YgiN
MYARSTTVRGNPQSIDDAIAYLRDEVMPAVQEMEGCVGLSMLCDRDNGRCIATTAWESEEAMHNSESGVHDMRQRFAQLLGGRAEVQEWEIGLLHRARPAPEGACCRLIRTEARPEDGDRILDAFRMTMLPRMDDLPGFCSVSLLGNRDTGRGVTAVVYENRDAMWRALELAAPMRDEFNRQMGSRVTEIEEFDLVLAHLRVPETV